MPILSHLPQSTGPSPKHALLSPSPTPYLTPLQQPRAVQQPAAMALCCCCCCHRTHHVTCPSQRTPTCASNCTRKERHAANDTYGRTQGRNHRSQDRWRRASPPQARHACKQGHAWKKQHTHTTAAARVSCCGWRPAQPEASAVLWHACARAQCDNATHAQLMLQALPGPL